MIFALLVLSFRVFAQQGAPCGGPLTYCAPTTTAALPIPAPPSVSTTDPLTGSGVMFTMPWSNAVAMRVTDGHTKDETSTFGLFYAGQSNPSVRSPMLGSRASENCNHSSPTCYYIRVIGSETKILWIDGGTNPLGGNWKMGQLCADNPNYSATNGYEIGPEYDYADVTGNVWHAPKFLQTPGSEGILIDVELRTPHGERNAGATGDDAWLVARDLTTCSSTVDVPETPVVDFSHAYPAFDPRHTTETQGYGPAFNEAIASSSSSSAGVVTLTGGTYCVTLNKQKGDDSKGTSAVCYDTGTGQSRWYDAVLGTAGGGWGQAGKVSTTCFAPPKCKVQGSRIVDLTMTEGPNPYLILALGNQTYWDTFSLNQDLVNYGDKRSEGFGIDIVQARSGQKNLFVARSVSSTGSVSAINFRAPKGWAAPSNFGYHIVFPAPLYLHSDQGVVFISTSDRTQTGTCTHDVGGTCGIYGLALDGSGTEYSFFPHYSSGAAGVDSDAQKANFSAYIDAMGVTWVYWGSDWLGNLGQVSGVNRADIFAAIVQ
jgi:hypothetical protein